MEKNVKADKMGMEDEVQPSPVLPSSMKMSVEFKDSVEFSAEIIEVMLAQPLNTIRRLEFSVAKTFQEV